MYVHYVQHVTYVCLKLWGTSFPVSVSVSVSVQLQPIASGIGRIGYRAPARYRSNHRYWYCCPDRLIVVLECRGLVSRQLSGSEAKLEELRQRVKVMDDALTGNAMSTNALENAKKNLETKVKVYEDKLHHLENSLVRSLWQLNHWQLMDSCLLHGVSEKDIHSYCWL